MAITEPNRLLGTWHEFSGSFYNLTIEAEVREVLETDGCTEEQIAEVTRLYREQINEALPPGFFFHGDQFYGPADTDPDNIDGIILGALDNINFWAIAEQVLA